jgi:hypothetical protein
MVFMMELDESGVYRLLLARCVTWTVYEHNIIVKGCTMATVLWPQSQNSYHTNCMLISYQKVALKDRISR